MKYFIEDAEKATLKGFIENDWTEADRIDNDYKVIFTLLFNRLISNKIKVFYQETDKNIIIWHRSTRPGVLIQESHGIKINGEIIPSSHQNINTVKDILDKYGYMTNVYIREL